MLLPSMCVCHAVNMMAFLIHSLIIARYLEIELIMHALGGCVAFDLHMPVTLTVFT